MKRHYQQQNHERSSLRQKLNENVFKDMEKKGDNTRTRSQLGLPQLWKTTFQNKCIFCSQYLKSIKAMGGHIKYCKAKREDVTTAPTTTVCTSYLDLQKKQLSFDNSLKTGFVELGNGTRVKGNWRHYLEVAKYVTINGIHGTGGDSLLELLKKITSNIGCEIAIPSRMRTLMLAVLKTFKGSFYFLKY
jgi:hypothetical protein